MKSWIVVYMNTEAVSQRWTAKIVFLGILQNPQENIRTRVIFPSRTPPVAAAKDKYFMFIHLWLYFRNLFFASGDFYVDWLFSIKLIWWNRTRPIFSKFNHRFDRTKICQILLYTLSSLFDPINLIKLIWPCISRLSFSFNNCSYFATSLHFIKDLTEWLNYLNSTYC